MAPTIPTTAGEAIIAGRTALGIELGSTRIKACLIDSATAEVLAVGSHEWQNELVDRVWTYHLDAVWSGLQAAFADLAGAVQRDHAVAVTSVGAIGVSGVQSHEDEQIAQAGVTALG